MGGSEETSEADVSAPAKEGEEEESSGLCPDDDPSMVRPSWWTFESHCKGIDGDYARIFPDDAVQRIDITVDPEIYQASMDNLEELLGGGGGPGGGGPGGPGKLDDMADPTWYSVDIEYDGSKWTNIGMRYKGNSSLHSAYKSGSRKLSMRFNFDKFEDDYPELNNQRFYGFKKMTFSGGFKDNSLIRDKVAAEIFREGGVPAARSAFYQLYIDYGSGSKYMGLYTMIEDPSDEMLETQFDDDDGTLYKPEGSGATWSEFDQESFEKATNDEDMDWSEIQVVFEALHFDKSDPAAWRAGLEAVFHVEAFLRWLAINQVIYNWDTYGVMNHNYYVYADPSDGGRLRWFPWDLNEAMLDHKGSVAGSIALESAGDKWPMIRFLMDDPVYRAQYKEEVIACLAGPFNEQSVHAKLDTYHQLIAPYVVGPIAVEESPYTLLKSHQDFEQAVSSSGNGLKAFVSARHTAVQQGLSSL